MMFNKPLKMRFCFLLTCVLLLSLLFSASCKSKNPSDHTDDKNNANGEVKELNVTTNQDYYLIGDTVKFSIDKFSSLDDFTISCSDKFAFVKNDDNTFKARKVGTFSFTFTYNLNPSLSKSIDVSTYSKSFYVYTTTSSMYVGDKIDVYIEDFEGLKETKTSDFNFSLNDDSYGEIKDGIFTAKKCGKVTITATSKFNSNVASSCYVDVVDKDEVFVLKSPKQTDSIEVGEEVVMSINMGYKAKDLVWSTTNSEVIRVTGYEDIVKVVAVGEGIANITCYDEKNPDIKASYRLKVNGVGDIDYVSRFINLAYEQVGIVEEGDNIQKFGKWYGNNGQPWCATFVSWCWWHSGLSNDLLLKYQGCATGMEWCLEKGIFKYKEEYTPKSGDIVFFLSNGASHTGIVAYCDNSYIYTIEGNRSNKVGIWRLSVNNKTITGYGVPNYPKSSKVADFSWISKKLADGTYLWTAVTNGEPTV